MIRELYVDSRMVEDEAGAGLRFDYYVLIGEVELDTFFCESYGVKIAQLGTDNLCEIPNITTSAARIDCLLELLLLHCVTPVNLPDVLADWL